MRRYISSALQHLLTIGLSIDFVFVATLASIIPRLALRGRNNSDVGVPMYENDDIARTVGLLVFTVVLLIFLFGLQRTLSRNLQWLPYFAAAIACVCFNQILQILLFW